MEKIVTGKVRFSYVHVFEPSSINGSEEKYSVTLLIPKTDTITYQKIMEGINKALQEGLGDIFKGVAPTNPSIPLYDGDGFRPGGEPFGAECKGHWVLSAKSNNAPEVVDMNVNPIISKNEFYSGCYGRASINFYAYNRNGNKGVGCGLGNVQKLEEGQPLDGRTTAAEDFGIPAQNNNFQPQPIPSPYQQVPIQPTMTQPQMQPSYQQAPVQPSDLIYGANAQQSNVSNIYGVN